MTTHTPRTVTSVLAEVGTDSVTITWGLGEPVDVGDVEFFGYGIYYYDPTGNGGKRLGVRFGDAITAWVFDNASATQANYEASSVTATKDAVLMIEPPPDASIAGMPYLQPRNTPFKLTSIT